MPMTGDIPTAVAEWLAEQGEGQIVNSRLAGGGCISNGRTVHTSSGKSYFLKTNPQVSEDFFKQEAAGLTALSVRDGPRIPKCFLVGREFILMEDLKPAARDGSYWRLLGQRLATLHNTTNDLFGFDEDNYIGSTPQPNTWIENGYEFFGDHRLRFQVRLAFERKLLGAGELRGVEALIQRLPELIPLQPASISHGDLWSGNLISDEFGMPALIDPAVYFGWAEADLAMMNLFGSVPDEFLRSYMEIRPLEPRLRARYQIYNLYHLLNHLNLFGGSYLHQVQAILKKYS